MGESEVDRVDAVGVSLFVPRAVRTADRVSGFRAELRLERIQKTLEEIQHERLGLAHGFAYFGVDQRGEDNGAAVSRCGGLVDPGDAGPGLVDRVDEGDGHLVEFDAVELRKQAVAQHLDGDPRAVGDEEHGSAAFGHEKGPGGVFWLRAGCAACNITVSR